MSGHCGCRVTRSLEWKAAVGEERFKCGERGGRRRGIRDGVSGWCRLRWRMFLAALVLNDENS